MAFDFTGFLGAIGDIALQGTPAGDYMLKREQQQKQSQLANLLNNPNVSQQDKMAQLAMLSPEFAQAQMSALTPQYQLEQQQAQSGIDLNKLRGLDINSQIDDRRLGRNMDAEKFAAELRLKKQQEQEILQQKEQQKRLQNYFANGGKMDARSLAALGVPLQDAATISKTMQPPSAADLYKEKYGNYPEQGFQAVTAPDGTLGVAPIAGSTRDPNSPNNEEFQKKAETLKAANALISAIDTYHGLVAESGVPAIGSKEEQQIQTAHSALTTNLKSFEKLGTLDQGTLDLVEKYMPEPSQFNKWNPFTDSIRKQVQGAAEAAKTDINNKLNALGINTNAEANPIKGGESGIIEKQFDRETGSFTTITPKKKDEGAMMQSPNPADFIKQKEGFSPVSYNDVAGYETTGYGHKMTGQETTNDPEQLFQQDLQTATGAIDRLVKVPLNEQQRTALASLVYNIGQGAFADSTLLKKLNSGDVTGAAAEFDRWVNAGGKPVKGLKNRRMAEKQLFTGAA